MDNKLLGFCAIAAVLGIISAVFGFAAEATRVKASEVEIIYNTCVYPSSPALALAIVASAFTIITQIYLTSIYLGSGCCINDPSVPKVSGVLCKFSWFASFAAVVTFLVAGAQNNRRSREGRRVDLYHIKCFVVKPGFFSVGAAVALLSVIFGIAAFLTIIPSPQTNTNPAVELPLGTNVGPERNPRPFPSPQHASR
ncbi:hypothetical protein M8C21_030508 [Ambrosia artemisiifolia]|uniref:Uncharacterized protein n=1 Tax=Ambrosia artemisiifolia TaxID=4212 RepID=A0AAD5CXY7_AMBAR|nr:hypothetical protein M8C21_030508 [Ambrosia artemisiifolia]